MMTNVNRRTFLSASAAGAAAGLAPQSGSARTQGALGVTYLRTAQLVDPLGLDDRNPSLSWQVSGARRGIMQVAYRIEVASSRAALKAGRADLWDSGRVASAVSTGVAYRGAPLTSRQRAWWTVTIWDDKGLSARASEPAWWEMALLNPADWTAQWIAAESAQDKADRDAGMTAFVVPTPPQGKPRLFRLPFTTDTAGDVMLTLFSSGFLENVTVDGVAITMPSHPYISYGGPAAARFLLPLKAGGHMLAAEVAPPRGFTPTKQVSVAAQLRLPQAQGGVTRIDRGWQTALTAPDGWRIAGASSDGWTAPDPQQPAQHPAWPAGPAAMLRHAFAASAKPKRARLYVAALGAYEIDLNGKPVSEDRLQSESSDYRKTILYRSYDVTDLVRAGDNVMGAMVGDGWYASYMAPAGRYAFGPAPRRLIAQLEIDGQVVARTGPGWRMAQAPIVKSELYNGEIYDARLEQPGWTAPGFDDSGWTDCWLADVPQGTLIPQAGPPVRLVRTITPVATTRPTPDIVVIDFGQNFAGLARLKAKGAAGAMVTMRFAEILNDNGTVDQRNLRAAQATDRYIFRGDAGGETYLPHFTFHGFRYVQIEGLAGDGWSVEGMEMGSALTETGTLRVDSPVMQKLWLNCLWSQRSNFLAIPTDCPQRDERLGWSGDAQVFWDAAAFNMDVAAFTRRFLRDLRDGQTVKGAFPIFAPIVEAPVGASPGWADAGVMLPWTCWRRYGDTAMVTEHWDAMARYIDGVITDNPDFIWRKVIGPDFSDWLSLDAKKPGDETTPKALVGTAMLKRSLDQMADMAEAIGKTTEAAGYRTKAAAAFRAFQSAFVTADGTVGNGSHASYILAIRLGLLTPVQKQVAGAKLVADIRRRGTLLSTGFLATPLSLDALADIGDTGLVYDLLLRTEFPSWGYMVRKGATTIWERWNADTGDIAMNSYNHYALGAVVGFLYRRVAGIEEMEPGFAKVRIAPLTDPRVRSGSTTYDSVRGRINVDWTRQPDDTFRLDIAIPANMQAQVHLPLADGRHITESDVPIERVDGMRAMGAAGSVIEVGSGHYRFAII